MGEKMKITELSGVGTKRAHSLYNAGIHTALDLLNYFPRDYDDRSNIKSVGSLVVDAVNTIRGTIATDPESATIPRKGAPALNITKTTIKDNTGTLEIVWFNQPYLKKYFKRGRQYVFTGKVKDIGKLQMQSPEYEPCSETELSHGRIVPVYTTPPQFSQKTFRALMYQALSNYRYFNSNAHHTADAESPNHCHTSMETPDQVWCDDAKYRDDDVEAGRETFATLTASNAGASSSLVCDPFPEALPLSIRQKYNLCNRKTAIFNIHFPESDSLFLEARRRLVFEELFFVQSALQNLKKATTSQPGITLPSADYYPFICTLPFLLTKAQHNVLAEISRDMTGGHRMNRLVQGDVGSGKTAVAMAAAYLAMKSGYQTALMAPTEVLANQHYIACQQLFAPLGFETVLLTGNLGAKARREALAKIADGSATMIIGTHALIQEKVEYARLGLVITDEQHRFGVNQRLTLAQKATDTPPHTLVMTATPIPRTLGMILYGDLDISIINELPPGRQVIKTYSVDSKYQARLHAFIRKEVEAKRQAYVICPAIEETRNDESENSKKDPNETKPSMNNVLAYTAALSDALPDIKIAHLHGRMKPAEKQKIMDNFKAGNINVLVSTTVIEVGVHVANATLMIIENAERFGLSQLHQLRGRVGRGCDQSYCVLVTDSRAKETKARMKAMCDTTDGFILAELDLKLRGAGDFFGTRQHGLPTFAIANLFRDMEILKEAQQAVADVQTINISGEELAILKQRIKKVLTDTQAGVM